MVKRTATIAVFLLVLSFTAFAGSFPLTGPGSEGGIKHHPIKYHEPCVPVPEPASVLAFGTVLLLGGRSLKRKFSGS